MEVKEVKIPFGRSDVFKVYPIGDEHIGTKHCHLMALQKKIKEIRDTPNTFWIGMGDKCEFITPGDPRWDIDVIDTDIYHPDNIAEDQSQTWLDLYSCIKHKCLGLLEGNHEDSIRKHFHVDVQKNICKRLGVDNLGSSCFIKFQFKRGTTPKNSHYQNYIGAFTHGAGCPVTDGAKINRLASLMNSFEADMVATGHHHDIKTLTKAYLTLQIKTLEIQQKVKVGAITGCWFKTYSQGVRASYSERKNYPPTTIGCPVFIINPDKRILEVNG